MSQTARARQAKKDQAIRKKAELNLDKKYGQFKIGSAVSGHSPSTFRGKAGSNLGLYSSSKNINSENTITEYYNGKLYLDGKLVKPGTVADLQPNIAFTAHENITIHEAAKLMAAKRAACVLVVDQEDRLVGIFTAKDIAFRVIAEGKNIHTTLVKEIATSDPFCVVSDASAIDALNTMVEKNFRHLPICNEEGDVIGLLDILKCMYDALDKMDRAYQTAQNLYNALEGVQREWSVQSEQLIHFVDTLREKMNYPTVESVVTNSKPLIVTPKTSVYEIAQLMKVANTTAALVIDEGQGLIAGIFTSKDIVLRVIAADIDPYKCSVVRVMTPQPDTISPETPIIDALIQMHQKNYLNLPIIKENGQIMGVANVLNLCYSTLEIMKNVNGENDGSEENGFNGPMWSQFFSVKNYSQSNTGSNSQVGSRKDNSILQSSTLGPPMSFINGTSHLIGDIFPNDSASMIDEITSAVNSRVGEKEKLELLQSATYNTSQNPNDIQPFPSNLSQHNNEDIEADSYYIETQNLDEHSNQISYIQSMYPNNPQNAESIVYSNSVLTSNNMFSFKLKTPYNNIHRFNLPINDYELLRDEIVERLLGDGMQDAHTLTLEVGLVYVDSENDLVQLNNQLDLIDAVEQAKSDNKDRVLIMVNTDENKIKARIEEKKLLQVELKKQKKKEILSKQQIRDTLVGPFGIPGKYISPSVIVGATVLSISFFMLASRVSKN
ncbi:hypothetical protein BB561_003120 [Smittium simulii]|uniref:CBS domain-containing protein n=1 Tax=Smittium simulii TaxID=133385 RepID=A0A2T9YMV4_9FUNG|nr:hypothetical protein BB561_003120 [Smittium simulii]